MAKLSSIKTPEHAQALEARDRFLGDHPELRDLQDAINNKLGNADSDHNRLVLIHQLMMDRFTELDEKLQTLIRRYRSKRS
jgi:hypothetical protein